MNARLVVSTKLTSWPRYPYQDCDGALFQVLAGEDARYRRRVWLRNRVQVSPTTGPDLASATGVAGRLT